MASGEGDCEEEGGSGKEGRSEGKGTVRVPAPARALVGARPMLPLLRRLTEQFQAQPHVRGVAEAHLVDRRVLEDGLFVDECTLLVLDHAARLRREGVHLNLDVGRSRGA